MQNEIILSWLCLLLIIDFFPKPALSCFTYLSALLLPLYLGIFSFPPSFETILYFTLCGIFGILRYTRGRKKSSTVFVHPMFETRPGERHTCKAKETIKTGLAGRVTFKNAPWRATNLGDLEINRGDICEVVRNNGSRLFIVKSSDNLRDDRVAQLPTRFK